MSTFTKDPHSVLDYTWDWSAWLVGAETIATHTLTASGVTVNSSTIVGSTVVAWLSGGTANTNATILCRITTSAGRIDDRTMRLRVVER